MRPVAIAALALAAAAGPARAQAPAGVAVSASVATPAPTAIAAPRAPAPAAQRKAQQAEEAVKAGDWRTALFAWQEAVNLDPENGDLRMRLGEAYERLAAWDEAARMFEVAAALAPPGTEALRRAERARALRDGKEPPPEPARASGTPAAPAYEAGVAAIAQGRYREALESLDEAVRKDPGLAVAYIARAGALFGLGRYVDSAADYRTALALDPSRATPLYGLGECNRLLGQGATAAEYYSRYVASGAPDARDDLRADSRRRLDELRK
jgi:tetratricopeptide (TPR) repeat protein